MAFAMAAMTVLLAAGCDDGMTGAVAAVVAGQQNGTGSNHAPSMPDGEIDDDGVLTKYTGNETAVTIPNGVTGIRGFAFEDCTALTDVAIPASVKSIEFGTFLWCESLETVTYNGTLAQWCAMDNDSWLMYNATSVILTGQNNMNLKQEATLKIPDGVERIGSSAFCDCTALTDVTIPASVTSIGLDAFFGCESLETVTYNGTLAQWCAMDAYCLMKYAEQVTMSDGTDLKHMTTLAIPDGVRSIGDGAFKNCAALTSVTIPASVVIVGGRAFADCTGLTDVTIPEGVTDIGYSAFWGCTKLATINYAGTKEQWNAITKGSNWDKDAGKYTITYNYKE